MKFECCVCGCRFSPDMDKDGVTCCPKCSAHLSEDDSVLERDVFGYNLRRHRLFPLLIVLLALFFSSVVFVDVFDGNKGLLFYNIKVDLGWLVLLVFGLPVFVCYWYISHTSKEDLSDIPVKTKLKNK